MSFPLIPHWQASARAARRPSDRTGRGRRWRALPAPPERLESRALLAAGSIQFSASAYGVADFAGRVPIVLTRTGGSDGAVSVQFSTSDGTAKAGPDYQADSETVGFAAGETSKTVLVVVGPEPIADVAGRTVNLSLSNPTGGASTGSPASAVATIRHVAAPGDLDGSFGAVGSGQAFFQTPGQEVNHYSLNVEASLVLPDGGSYAATPYSRGGTTSFGVTLVKVKPDGTPDASFGQGGTSDAYVAEALSLHVNQVATQADGKVLVVGDVFPKSGQAGQALLVRYNPDGTPDPTFGTNGVFIDNVNGPNTRVESYKGAVLLGNGEILTAGTETDSSQNSSILLRLHKANGALDTSYGANGTVLAGGTGASSAPVLENGKVVVGGTAGSNFVLYRFNLDGTADATFGANGAATGPSGLGYAGPLLVQPDGKILQAGGPVTGPGSVVRYLATGQVDPTFGDNGVARAGVTASALALQPTGEVLVGGLVNTNGPTTSFGVTRLAFDGTPDPGFGVAGTRLVAEPASVSQQHGTGFEHVTAVGVAPPNPGKPGNDVLLTGSGFNNRGDYELARFLGAAPLVKAPTNDFDGDGKSDPAIFRQSNDLWVVNYSSGGKLFTNFGDPSQGDVPVPGDYDGDGKTDLAVFRPSTDTWIIQPSSGGPVVTKQFGDPAKGDVPIPGNYEGNGQFDLALFRASTEQWIVRYANGSTPIFQFGDPAHNDLPVPGDYEGIGKYDLALFRPGTGQWIVRYANGSTPISQFGDPAHGDIAAPGDYDGDGKTDLAIFRPGTALFAIQYSGGGKTFTQLGDPSQGDLPVAAPLSSLGLIHPGGNRAFFTGRNLTVAPTTTAGDVAPPLPATNPGPVSNGAAPARSRKGQNAWLDALDALTAGG